jgi:hypothetical protein
MDSDTMLGIHMFGDVQTSVQVQECGECGAEFTGAGFPIGSEGCWISNPNCGNCYGRVDGVWQEVTTTDPYRDLIELIELYYGDWAYRVLDRYTAQALWSLADEHGAHNALEFLQSQDNLTETL